MHFKGVQNLTPEFVTASLLKADREPRKIKCPEKQGRALFAVIISRTDRLKNMRIPAQNRKFPKNWTECQSGIPVLTRMAELLLSLTRGV